MKDLLLNIRKLINLAVFPSVCFLLKNSAIVPPNIPREARRSVG